MKDQSKEYISSINTTKNYILDKVIIIGAIGGVIAYVLSLMQSFISGLQLSFITDFIVVGAIGLIAFYRKSLSINFKSTAILIGISIVVLVDVYEIGILSANKVLLILIPFFAIMSYSAKKTIIFSVATLIGIIILAYMHITKILTFTESLQFGVVAWVINLIMIAMVSIVVILIVKLFVSSYEELIRELQSKNDSLRESQERLRVYQHELEDKVTEKTEKLRLTNEELKRKKNEAEQSYEKLKLAQHQLVETEKMATLGLMASGIAHEINNPLNYIKGGISALEIELKQNIDKDEVNKITPYIEAANVGVSRISQIVKSMNAYNQSKAELTPDCDLNEIVRNCIQLLSKSISENIEIMCDFNLPSITGNSGKLHQIISNILSNSLHAIEGGGSIKIYKQVVGDKLSIVFEDSGIGISESKLSQVFDPFFTTKEAGKGTGLGLHISNSLMKEHGGSISLSSTLGVGTRVSLNFNN